MVGLNDGVMPWAEYKYIYINHEKDVIAGLNYNVIEPLCGLVKASLFTSKRVVYTRSGVPAGTLASAIVFNGSIEFGHLAGTASNMKVSDYSCFNLTALESKVLFFY